MLLRRRLLSSLPDGIEQAAGPPLVANGLEMTSLFVPSLDGKHKLHVKRVGGTSMVWDGSTPAAGSLCSIRPKCLDPLHCNRSVATPRHRPPPAGMVPCASFSTARFRTAASSTPPRANGGWV